MALRGAGGWAARCYGGRGVWWSSTLFFCLGRQVTPGGAVTIRCQGWHQNATFLLYKDGNPKVLQDTEPAGDMAEFPISSVSRRDAGSYCCRYTTLELVVAGREYPKPTISVTPSRVVALGGSVTIRCEGQYSGMMFFLHKAGHPNLQVRTVRDWTVAEFPIPSASQEDGGSYTCDYCPITDQSRWSYPSDPVEIIVGGEGGARPPCSQPHPLPDPNGGSVPMGHSEPGFALNPNPAEGTPLRGMGCRVGRGLSQATHQLGGDGWKPSYPKPSISLLSPSGGVSLGGAMTVRCRGQYLGKRFMLNKEGRHVQSVDSDGFGAEFPISHVSREDGGRYSCSYRSKSELFTESYPSDPVELVVRGERPAIISPPQPSLV
uniref:Ig-like domain-containing protein n=1 Tax=Chelonoidis abingdonii TaxID=106734 RepID=A0A8C0H8C3_CHEAB